MAYNIGWDIVSIEKYPKFDKITEFMNVALIPIGLVIALAMYGLASCSTDLS